MAVLKFNLYTRLVSNLEIYELLPSECLDQRYAPSDLALGFSLIPFYFSLISFYRLEVYLGGVLV